MSTDSLYKKCYIANSILGGFILATYVIGGICVAVSSCSKKTKKEEAPEEPVVTEQPTVTEQPSEA